MNIKNNYYPLNKKYKPGKTNFQKSKKKKKIYKIDLNRVQFLQNNKKQKVLFILFN